MKKILLILFVLLFVNNIQAQSAEQKKNSEFGRIVLTLVRNLNAGYSFNNTTNYRLSSYHAGTNYTQPFKRLPAANWQLGAYARWSDYQMKNGKPDFSTTSVSVPFRIGYRVYADDNLSLRINFGPTYEYVLQDTFSSSEGNRIQRSQLSLSAGAVLSIANITRLYVSYEYYPIGLLSNGDFKRSSFNFSIGL
ncbi:hypothetical protein D0T49_06785 [Paludibacter sp. 221]|uniref:outer membrane beta-barrel protein n=1 Tax=Paludibacter sp. 221 TaxID=2302939 RepID=UPI0013D6C1C0|nr:outer membrane beta-barrel protein [Paludibacter sp. 221]NDV46751.1 hypothetical protein [Paludibacter sp. 221]